MGLPTSGNFRPDIEGLRAVAILTVLAYHAGLPFMPGGFIGVDVFFVISGFLITGLLVSEMRTTGTASVARFYARRVKRLLPSIWVVLITVCVLSYLILSPFRRVSVGGDDIAAGLFVANWHFGAQAVDYLGAEEATSPVLHFWSLAVEEQFYLVWPLLLLALTRVKRRADSDLTRPLLLGLGAVFVPSLVWSVYQTQAAAGWAYFSSFTRAWELALGGGLAMVVPTLRRLPRPAAIALGWGGLVAVLWSAVGLSQETPYPGVAALVPTVGAAALLAAGAATSGVGVSRGLSLPVMRHVGRISYSWYLWHWPLLIFAAAWVGHELSPAAGVAVVAFSYLPALAMHRYVEEPFRGSTALVTWPKRAFVLATVIITTVVAAGLLLVATGPSLATPAPGTALGAQLLPTTTASAPASAKAGGTTAAASPSLQTRVSALTPALSDARADLPTTYGDGCHRSFEDTSAAGCVFGKPDGPKTIVLFGDSHAAQWFPALRALADQRGWRFVSLTKRGCPGADVTPNNATIKRDYTECPEWRANALARIEKERPDVVVTTGITGYTLSVSGQRVKGPAAEEALRKGWVRTLTKLVPTTDHVVVLRDTPEPNGDPVDCVSANLDQLDRCANRRSDALPADLPLDQAARSVSRVEYVDLSDAFCIGDRCPSVIGNVLVYRDKDHITATYSKTLAPRLLGVLSPLLG